jgi:hypothetical protein
MPLAIGEHQTRELLAAGSQLSRHYSLAFGSSH